MYALGYRVISGPTANLYEVPVGSLCWARRVRAKTTATTTWRISTAATSSRGQGSIWFPVRVMLCRNGIPIPASPIGRCGSGYAQGHPDGRRQPCVDRPLRILVGNPDSYRGDPPCELVESNRSCRRRNDEYPRAGVSSVKAKTRIVAGAVAVSTAIGMLGDGRLLAGAAAQPDPAPVEPTIEMPAAPSVDSGSTSSSDSGSLSSSDSSSSSSSTDTATTSSTDTATTSSTDTATTSSTDTGAGASTAPADQNGSAVAPAAPPDVSSPVPVDPAAIPPAASAPVPADVAPAAPVPATVGVPATAPPPQTPGGGPGQPPAEGDLGRTPPGHRPPPPDAVPVCAGPWLPCWPSGLSSDGPAVCISTPPPPPNAAPPPPFEFLGQVVAPYFDQGRQQWGFWHANNWVPVYAYAC